MCSHVIYHSSTMCIQLQIHMSHTLMDTDSELDSLVSFVRQIYCTQYHNIVVQWPTYIYMKKALCRQFRCTTFPMFWPRFVRLTELSGCQISLKSRG